MLSANKTNEVDLPARNGFTGHTWTVGSRATGLAQPQRARPRTTTGRQWIGERYQVLRHLAQGGMGELYLARDRDSQRLVAIKRVHEHLADRSKIIKMFRDEANLAARIDHPNVVRVVDRELEGSDSAFIAMEYVAGKTLADLARRVRPPVLISAGIAAQVAAGLHAAHELRDELGDLIGTVHQDVSPQNIIIGYDGQVKLIDFGVARTRNTTRCVDINAIRGKLAYMAPEQMLALRLDRRVDIFALGTVLYEITTMTRLFKAKDEATIRERVLHGAIIPPSHIVPGYPKDLERIVLRALKRNPAHRYRSAEEMQHELQGLLGRRARSINNAISSMMSQVFGNRRVRRQIESPRVHRMGRCCTSSSVGCEASLDCDDEVTRYYVPSPPAAASSDRDSAIPDHDRMLQMLAEKDR